MQTQAQSREKLAVAYKQMTREAETAGPISGQSHMTEHAVQTKEFTLFQSPS